MSHSPDEGSPSDPLLGIGRIASLDGLRALAILPVIAAHSHVGWMPGGGLGVDIFFVLSGFLITSLLMGEVRRTGKISLRSFWLRRTIRLAPALLIVVVIVDALMGLALLSGSGDNARTTLHATPSVLFYYSNWLIVWTASPALGWFGPLWSLSVEEQFYLAWPLLIVGLARSKRLVVLGIGIAGSAWGIVVIRRYLTFDGSDKYATFATTFRVDALMVGCVLAFVLATRFRHKLESVARFGSLPALAMIATFTVVGPDFNNASLAYTREYYVYWLPVIEVASAVLIAHAVLNGSEWLPRMLNNRLLVYLGTISYGLYLWHYPVILILRRVSPLEESLLFIVVTLVTIAIASASWRFAEKPSSRLMRARLTRTPHS